MALQVGKAEYHLPSLPSTRLGWEAFPIFNLMWEVLGCKDSHQGHPDKFDVGNRHAGLPCFFLCILHHDNELGGAIPLHVLLHHISALSDSAAGVKEGHDVDGRDLCVEGAGIFQNVVPNLINNIAEKFGYALLGRLVTGVVIELEFVGSLHTNKNNFCGGVSNCLVVEWETSRAYKFGTMVGFVLDGLDEDGHEGVNPIQLVVGDDHEKWEKGLLDG